MLFSDNNKNKLFKRESEMVEGKIYTLITILLFTTSHNRPTSVYYCSSADIVAMFTIILLLLKSFLVLMSLILQEHIK